MDMQDSYAGEMTFEAMKELLRGKMGIQGWDGHTPMHVQETRPVGSEVRQGDLWYKPSTEQLFLYTGDLWPEICRQGPIGLEGERGPAGKDGKDSKVPGPKGKDGKDGKDADLSEIRLISDVSARSSVKEHEAKFDHSKIDPFLIGSKKLSEAGMSDGDFIQYDASTDGLKYSTIKQVASHVSKMGGRGLSLPSQTGNSGKFLTTDGQRSSWGTPAGAASFSDKEVPSGAINDVNVAFTIAHTPVSGSEHLYRNGVLQNSIGSSDYSISGTTITMTTAPATGDVLLVSYRYV